VFVALSGPLVPRLRRSVLAAAFLDGVNVVALALMTAVTWQLGRAALVDAATVGLARGECGLASCATGSTRHGSFSVRPYLAFWYR